MKITKTKIYSEPTFEPIKLEIIIETKEEFDSLYEIANYETAVANRIMDDKPLRKVTKNSIGIILNNIYEALQ